MASLLPEGEELIKRNEGCRLSAYQDQHGIWTIGYGHTGPEVIEGLCWSQDQADEAFAADIARFDYELSDLFYRVPTTDHQFSAMVSLAYNIGLAAFRNSHVARYHCAGDYAKAERAFLMWDKIEEDGHLVESNGLARRRQEEADLYAGTDNDEKFNLAAVPVAPSSAGITHKAAASAGVAGAAVGVGIAAAQARYPHLNPSPEAVSSLTTLVATLGAWFTHLIRRR